MKPSKESSRGNTKRKSRASSRQHSYDKEVILSSRNSLNPQEFSSNKQPPRNEYEINLAETFKNLDGLNQSQEGGQNDFYKALEKELLDIVSVFSKERKKRKKEVEILKKENDLLKKKMRENNSASSYQANSPWDKSYDHVRDKSHDDMRRSFSMEKQEILSQWKDESEARARHIKILNDKINEMNSELAKSSDIEVVKDKIILKTNRELIMLEGELK